MPCGVLQHRKNRGQTQATVFVLQLIGPKLRGLNTPGRVAESEGRRNGIEEPQDDQGNADPQARSDVEARVRRDDPIEVGG